MSGRTGRLSLPKFLHEATEITEGRPRTFPPGTPSEPVTS